jgi:hypothetical protein
MSGRGKGGKGLGKWVTTNSSLVLSVVDHWFSLFLSSFNRGGAKRHRKILRDNIQGITKPVRSRTSMVFFNNILTVPLARPFAVLPDVEVLSVSQVSFTKKHVVF